MKTSKDVDSYIKEYPKNIQVLLEDIRRVIKKTAPKAEEVIRYGIPTFRLNDKNLMHFGGFKNHVSFFPGPVAIAVFEKELTAYKVSKGTIQFPIDKKLPLKLITKIVNFRLTQSVVLKKGINEDVQDYNKSLSKGDAEICNVLATEITHNLPKTENKIWHAHPVWFLEGNPIVGYSKLKDSVRLLFWSGQSFKEESLKKEGSFKAAQIPYASVEQINKKDLRRWLKKAKEIQWDYKNIVKRKGVLKRL